MKASQSEEFFQKGYKLYLEDCNSNSLTSSLKFLPYLKKSAKSKNPKAMFLLGYILVVPHKDIPVDINRGNKILKKAFNPLSILANEKLDPLACYFLSKYYSVPLLDFVKDDQKVENLLVASKQYQFVRIDSKDIKNKDTKEIKDTNKENEQESLLTITNLIGELNSGLKDKFEILKTIKFLADNDDVHALLLLGDIYQEGKLVEKNDDLALAYYIKAERLGSTKAIYNIGKLYLQTNSSKLNITLGLNKIYLAAKRGLKEALFELGKIYYEGNLVEKDLNKAYIYFQASYSRNYIKAKEYLLKIEQERGYELSKNFLN